MGKQEFLEKLRLALNGKVSAAAVAENIHYYEDYINTEMRKGKSEEEVLESLGDPRLIARTIAETSGEKEGQPSGSHGSGNSGRERASYQKYGQEDGLKYGWMAKIPGWVWLILLLVIAVLVLSVVFHVLSFFAPVLIVIAVVLFLVKLFRDWIG